MELSVSKENASRNNNPACITTARKSRPEVEAHIEEYQLTEEKVTKLKQYVSPPRWAHGC